MRRWCADAHTTQRAAREVPARAFSLIAARVAAAARVRAAIRRACRNVAHMRAGADRAVAGGHEYLGAPWRGYVADIHVIVDVVLDGIVRAVVLVVPRALGARGDVAREELITAALVRVERPAAVIVALHVVADIIDDLRAGLVAQRVPAARD